VFVARAAHEDGDGSMTDEPAVQRHVSVEGVRLRFAAAHMATLGDTLEPLHGHNYRVRCRVEGTLTADRWVIDFAALKRVTREACERLDHRFLLQTQSSLRHGAREYVFPAADVMALPLENTTAELIAQWLWEQVSAALAAEGVGNLARLAVEVEEMPGQAGGYAAALPAR
jgi:6-pyruvoyltetrahydropterin/6-carboxytetrahydropterin synthase